MPIAVTRRNLAAVGLLLISAFLAGAQTSGPLPLPEGTVLLRENAGLIQRSRSAGSDWSRVSGLPERVLPAERAGEPLPITAVAVEHPGRENRAGRAVLGLTPGLKQPGVLVSFPGGRVLVAVGLRLFESRDGLESWREVELAQSVSRATYITAIAIDPQDPDHWIIGTSYDGLFQSRDAGDSWTDLTERRATWPIYQGAGFFDEISRLWFTPQSELIVELAFGGGYLSVSLDPLAVRRLSPLTDERVGYQAISGAIGTQLFRPLYRTALWEPGRALAAQSLGHARERRQEAVDQRGIYLSAQNAHPELLDAYFDLMDRFSYNSLIVDFKDDEGRITYESSVPLAREIGAVTPMIEPRELISRAHARGFSVVARVVVFKDPKLFAYDNNRYAYWDRERQIPWGRYRVIEDGETGARRTVNVEPWVDAYSPDVWDYVVAVSQEIESMGIDEIQFDYVRFPSDGAVQNIESRFRPQGADQVQALEAFLSAAQNRLQSPISIDVFGFNAWARMSYLGQDISRLSAYVDVISPMAYPSHYARAFLPQFTYLERAYHIYRSGTYRAQALAGPRTIIRPYVQAFLIGPELEFERPTFERYLQLQIEGLEDSPASGYTLWNASGRYYMLPR
jgi:hypothetical protein